MRLVPRIDNLIMENLPSANILTVKDYSAFKDNSSGNYYVSSARYLDKLYKSIGIKNYQFVKSLYELDSRYMMKSVQDRLGRTNYRLYSDNSNLYIWTKEFFFNYRYLIDLINNKYSKKYVYESDRYTQDTYLVLDNNVGLYFIISFIKEKLDVYNAQVSDGKLYLSKNASYDFADDKFLEFVNNDIESPLEVKNYYEGDENMKLSWFEYNSLANYLKIDLSDDELKKKQEYGNLVSQIKMSPYTLSYAFKLINDNIAKDYVHDVSFIYDKVQNQSLRSYQFS